MAKKHRKKRGSKGRNPGSTQEPRVDEASKGEAGATRSRNGSPVEPCVACQGSGRNSRGNPCIPCQTRSQNARMASRVPTAKAPAPVRERAPGHKGKRPAFKVTREGPFYLIEKGGVRIGKIWKTTSDPPWTATGAGRQRFATKKRAAGWLAANQQASECPKCGASGDDPCVRPSGVVKTKIHKTRKA